MENNVSPAQHPSQPPPEANHYQHYHDDEIDLVDIWRLLVRWWRWIAAITLLSTALAVAYVLLAPRLYKVEAFVLPPLSSDIDQLAFSVIRRDVEGAVIAEVNGVAVEDVYGQALTNLQSRSVRRLFFDEHNLFDLLRDQGDEDVGAQKVFTRDFHQRLTVTRGKKERSDFTIISLEGSEPERITSLLNSFLTLVNGYSVAAMVQDVHADVGAKRESIVKKISALRQIAEDRRLDRVVQLQEALYIASQLGIDQRAVFSSAAFSQTKANPGFGVIVNSADTPLYLRGTQALQAEIDMLRKRKSDDPFIGPLRNLQKELAQLDEIAIDPTKIKAFRLDQPALKPDAPIKPKRNLVVALGFVLGLMLGIFAAFLANFIETARRSEE